MRIVSAINAGLFFAIAVKGLWDHDARVLCGAITVLAIWAVIWPDLTEQRSRR